MARVFLSYDRDDVDRARLVASVLGKSGHHVWWDQHIRAGTQYSKEIEEALEQADAVVVLWSRNSIDSAWVRDEAAAGRDSGRLVPVTIDGAQPPLGFRQFQTIELARWKGRKATAEFAQLLSAIGKSDKSNIEGQHQQNITSRPAYWVSPWLIIAILVAAIAALAALFWSPWRAKNDAPMVAVVAAEPNTGANSLAADLLIKLGVLQSSHADALQLVDIDSRQTPDFIIKVGSARVGQGAQANLLLVDNRDGTLLWSGEFSEPSGRQADLRQQMAYSAAKVLDCAVQVVSATDQRIGLPTLKLYLSGCANLSNLLAQDPRAAVAIFTKVTEQAPKFEGAWKKLLLADVQTFRVSDRSDPVLRRNLENRIEKARRLNPAIAETFLAEAWLRPPRPVAGWIDRVQLALARDPDNPDILAYHSIALSNVGLMQEALTDARRAVRSDPLSPAARDALVTAMLNIGQVDAAKEELQKSEQLWPGATSVLQARFAVEFRVGDASRALAILQSGQLGAGYTPSSAQANSAHESYLKARIEPTTNNKAKAISDARTLYEQDATNSWVYARALSEFGGHEELIDFLLTSDARVPVSMTWTIFRTSFDELHQDPRFMQIARRLGVLDYWQDTGRWPDFCGQPDLPYDCKKEAAKLGA